MSDAALRTQRRLPLPLLRLLPLSALLVPLSEGASRLPGMLPLPPPQLLPLLLLPLLLLLLP
jgi:hypothetical protein